MAGSAVIKDVMFGDEAAENRNYLQVTQPMINMHIKAASTRESTRIIAVEI